jgi:hypothetical protein
MNRRDLLKNVGVGSAAVAAAPIVGNILATAAVAGEGGTGFHFVSVAAASASEVLAMQGDGRFNHEEVEGGGRFVHFHGAAVISGTWKARKLRSFVDAADFDPNGQFSGGTLVLDIQLRPIGHPRVDAMLTIQCNPPGVEIPEEGITVRAIGLTFEPARGLTILTPHERED